MYVDRVEHQRELRRAIRSGYNVIIYGDSGCGKSWLYKKVFSDENIFYVTLDLNNCKSDDDIDLLALEIIEASSDWVEVERSHAGEAGIMPSGVGLKGNKSTKFRRKNQSALEQLCSYAAAKSRGRRPFIVFENLEHCLDNESVVATLRSLVLSIDDEMSARSTVQLCFVGVPADIKAILADNNRYQTIANRIAEIPELERMSKQESRQVIYNGFIKELQMSSAGFEFCVSQIQFLSDRIPQYIHDICLQIAFVAEDENRNEINPGLVVDGATRWVETNARQSRDSVERVLKYQHRSGDLRAIALYSLANLDHVSFTAAEVEEKIRNDFPIFAASRKRLSAARMLNEFCDGNSRILKFDADARRYRIVTPKLRSVVRHYLQKDAEVVVLRDAQST
ncbi:AAA family ATPase [Paracoccus sphaerophysae]|uniref:AAA family ATPase n=1 Tax=Paracoccus sphaerophysae TaxID=690417 RepID=UPI0023557B85|nr:AAA family ATPase [Paracoccus sphaerophysae]